MNLPVIRAYPMPTAGELPRNVASWVIDPSRAALLIHDMQRYFIRPFPAGERPVTDLVRNIAAIREHCAAAGVPVLYTAQPGGMAHRDRGLLRDFWGDGMPPSEFERGVVGELAPGPADTVFTKWSYTGFHRNGLGEFLRARRRDQLIICGVYAHVGCLQTACSAFTDGIQPFLVADAVADFGRDQHLFALRYVAELVGMAVTTRTVTQWLLPAALAS